MVGPCGVDQNWTQIRPPNGIRGPKFVRRRKKSLHDLHSAVWWAIGFKRPLLIPLYRALHRMPTTMIGMDHITFQIFVNTLNVRLHLDSTLAHCHQSLLPGISLLRIANTNVKTLEEVKFMHIKSRRVWIGISDPSTPHRKPDEEALDALLAWAQLLVSTPFSLSMCPPTHVPVQATADAMP